MDLQTQQRDAFEKSDAFFVTTLQGWVYKTHEMHDDRLIFFVTTLQGWAYKTQKRDACEQSDAFFVTTLQGWVYKTQQTREMMRCVAFLGCYDLL